MVILDLEPFHGKLRWKGVVLTLAGTRHFAILDGIRGGGGVGAPLGVSKVCVVEISEKTGGLPLMSTCNGGGGFLNLSQNFAQL